MRRFSKKLTDDRIQRRKPRTVRPLLETLEDRTVPTIGGWALPADPEGYVYVDNNSNGQFDAGETALAGMTVYVDTNNNSALDPGETSTTTDATGHYGIMLPDGTYTIRVVPPAGFQTDARALGNLDNEFASVESGASGSFSGLAWVNDSLYVTFERSSAAGDNVMYQVDPQTGAALGSPVSIPADVTPITFDGTDFWGADFNNNLLIRFNFAGQELQRLSFAGIQPFGVAWDGAALRVLDNTSHQIYQIDPSGNGTILGSINTPSAAIAGLAYDGTSLWINEFGSHTIYGLDPTTGAVQHSFTYNDGATYGNVLGLAVHNSNIWLADIGPSRIFEYDLGFGGGRIVTVAGSDVSGIDLRVFQPASISGTVFSDNNQNGVQDSNDGGIPGWRVYIDANGNSQYDPWESSAVADSVGNYSFSGIWPGSYTVISDVGAQQLTRWHSTSPAGASYSLTLNSGDTTTGVNFGSFLDRSAPQPNEWGSLGGGRMNLYTGLSWVDDSVLSGGGMSYAYAANYIASSTYAGFDDWRMPTLAEAQEAAKNGAATNMPLAGNPAGNHYWWTSTVAKTQGKTVYYWVLDLRHAALAPVAYPNQPSYNGFGAMLRDSETVIDDGATGYSATGFTSTSNSGAYQGDQSTASSGTGSKTATWTFSGLDAGGTYKVAVTWKTVRGAASNAPFKVIDGTTTVASVAMNQQVNPNDFAVNSNVWQGLGTFTLTSNTLKVQLSNLANGTVIADAVRIFEVFPSYAPPAPLVAANLPTGTSSSQKLTASALKPLFNEAIRRWEGMGISPSVLHGIDVRIADLGGSTLGLASGRTITLDDNAAGWGWFVDKTVRSDSEFTKPGNQGEQNRMDLLTVLMHEVGHIIGYDHSATPGSLMNETLAAGTRENPGTGLVTKTDFWGSLIAQAQLKKQKSAFGAFLAGRE